MKNIKEEMKELEEKEEMQEIETTKNQEYVRVLNGEFQIDKIIIVQDRDDSIKQIRFLYDGETMFTYSPKKYSEEKNMLHGFETIKRIVGKYAITEIPEKLTKINKVLNKNGELKVNLSYTEWHTKDQDGTSVTYNILNKKDFLGLMIFGKDNKEIIL